jgi:hypothetical protein
MVPFVTSRRQGKKLGGCLTSLIPLSMVIYCASLTYLHKGHTDVQPQTCTQPWYPSTNELSDTKIYKLTLILLNSPRVYTILLLLFTLIVLYYFLLTLLGKWAHIWKEHYPNIFHMTYYELKNYLTFKQVSLRDRLKRYKGPMVPEILWNKGTEQQNLCMLCWHT